MVKNGSEMVKHSEYSQNGQCPKHSKNLKNGQKWPIMVKMVENGQNGQMFKLVKNHQKVSKMQYI